MKANFNYDPDFPVIDGVGHSDKIDFFNVKGGGSTNTTFFDLGYGDSHCWTTVLERRQVSTERHNCRVDADVTYNSAGTPSVTNPNCLNSIGVGNSNRTRSSDRVALDRVEISGTVRRPSGADYDPFSNIACAPKCYVALVLDTQSNGAALSSHPLHDNGNGFDSNELSGVPMPWEIEHSGGPSLSYYERRFRFLAVDVIDFALNPETRYDWVDYANSWNTTGVPPDTESLVTTREQYSFWRDVCIGFRFDVDLNGVLCQFIDSPDLVGIQTCADLSLHVFALCFDGVSADGYVPHNFGKLQIAYNSRLWFHDWISPRPDHVAPGADGGVVPDDEVPLAVLADQSAAMAGDGVYIEAASRDRPTKRTKASHGYYNFLPRAGDAMLFDDDPEYKAIAASQRNSKGYSRVRVRQPDVRRKFSRVDDADDPDVPFDYLPRWRDDNEWEGTGKFRRRSGE